MHHYLKYKYKVGFIQYKACAVWLCWMFRFLFWFISRLSDSFGKYPGKVNNKSGLEFNVINLKPIEKMGDFCYWINILIFQLQKNMFVRSEELPGNADMYQVLWAILILLPVYKETIIGAYPVVGVFKSEEMGNFRVLSTIWITTINYGLLDKESRGNFDKFKVSMAVTESQAYFYLMHTTTGTFRNWSWTLTL